MRVSKLVPFIIVVWILFSSFLSISCLGYFTKTITIDGDFSDWADVPVFVYDGADAGVPSEVDIITVKIAHDTSWFYWYIKFEGVPSLGSLPYEHRWVFQVDTNNDGSYEYYVEVYVYISLGLEYTISVKLLGDGGDGVYETSDTTLYTYTSANFAFAPYSLSSEYEGKFGINDFFSYFALTFGDTVWMSLLTQSPGDETSRESYTFETETTTVTATVTTTSSATVTTTVPTTVLTTTTLMSTTTASPELLTLTSYTTKVETIHETTTLFSTLTSLTTVLTTRTINFTASSVTTIPVTVTTTVPVTSLVTTSKTTTYYTTLFETLMTHIFTTTVKTFTSWITKLFTTYQYTILYQTTHLTVTTPVTVTTTTFITDHVTTIHTITKAITSTYVKEYGFCVGADKREISLKLGRRPAKIKVLIESKGDFDARNVELSYSWIGEEPHGVTVSISLYRPHCYEQGAVIWKLTLRAGHDASPGVFTLRILGTSGSLEDYVDIVVSIKS